MISYNVVRRFARKFLRVLISYFCQSVCQTICQNFDTIMLSEGLPDYFAEFSCHKFVNRYVRIVVGILRSFSTIIMTTLLTRL